MLDRAFRRYVHCNNQIQSCFVLKLVGRRINNNANNNNIVYVYFTDVALPWLVANNQISNISLHGRCYQLNGIHLLRLTIAVASYRLK